MKTIKQLLLKQPNLHLEIYGVKTIIAVKSVHKRTQTKVSCDDESGRRTFNSADFVGQLYPFSGITYSKLKDYLFLNRL
jgi:hypothetical protein